ncbi:response regulator transcription factor [Streptomyces sp. URMC 127]
MLIEDDLLRLGLQALLPRISTVREVFFPAQHSGHRGTEHDAPLDVVLTSGYNRGVPRPAVEFPPPSPRVLMIIDSSQLADEADFSGCSADGYLLRNELTAESLEQALAQLASGQMPMPLSLGRSLVHRATAAPPAAPPAELTAREKETLLLLVEGLSNKQIGRQLSISVHGAKRLVGSVLVKLGAANRTAAVVAAIKAGLVEPCYD